MPQPTCHEPAQTPAEDVPMQLLAAGIHHMLNGELRNPRMFLADVGHLAGMSTRQRILLTQVVEIAATNGMNPADVLPEFPADATDRAAVGAVLALVPRI